MTADSGQIRSVHSWRATELAIPPVAVVTSVDPRVVRPAALRFPIDVPRPAVTRIGLFDARPVVQSFRFQPSVAPPPAVPKRAAAAAATVPRVPPSEDLQAGAESGSPPPPPKRTRIAPPADVVKLSERFFYLLQPDLETILETSSLEFPRQPFPFQFDGMAFLMPRHGAVLADEMGLGKSMQAISSIRLLVRLGEARRVLVVCPKGLVSNWTRELADWAPELLVAVIEGDQQRRRWQWSLADVPVKVANYEVLVRDRELIAELGLSFDLMVLDEAQRIKNRSSQTSEAVRSVTRRRSWALTGTPVENSSDDLVGVFEFIAPGHLNERMSPRAMGAAAADHVLRRTKDKVLKDMPPRLNRDERIELTPEQRETYRRAEEEGVLRLADLGQEATIQNVFELVLRLKQICNFDTFTGESAKLECLEADLEEIHASGKKALVFSQWVKTLGRLRGKLSRFGALEYHGGMSTAARDEAIRQFKHEKQHSVLLLSYGAGAVGLNLQFSQYVFLFDRWWNPAVEDQAINRAHRIGAVGAVTVTRFLSANTIEERIDEVLRRKRDLSDMILSQAEAPAASGLTQDDLFALFKLAPPRLAAPIRAA
ncbi:MAG: DEAD/DEAH box helicase [Planctomycetia bacterium]|nr:DEAD/DEAH box helicase [Planctomycetia bacterium]